MLAHLRCGHTYAQLAAGFGVGTTTAYRYIAEAVDILAALAPTLAEAVRTASGKAFVIEHGCRPAHPSNAATAATAGFKVIILMLDENGYPSLDALKAAVSDRTAALMVNNPDDIGVYNPDDIGVYNPESASGCGWCTKRVACASTTAPTSTA
ncbi:glycine dehydrogenase (decarboxylating) subunit 2 [Streptomyces antimycoticus]